ncbi:MAG: hypothetical protein E6J40_14855 [Chloroflexi bacterium]|nr:MAG: hypothetical protein E6J40_14855 [Chloroflexota bacterium]
MVAALSTLTALDASHAAKASQQARLQGRSPQAIEFGLRATRGDQGRPDYWDTLGLAYVEAQRLNDAALAFRRASELAPYDVRYLGDLARAYLELAQKGDTAAGRRARDAAETAVRADPNNPQAQFTRALVMQVTDDLPEALRSAERALALDPQSMTDALWVTATQIELASGHPTEAVSVARQGLAVFGATKRTIPLRMELARALAASGGRSDALHELDIALSIQPNDPSVLQLRAQINAGSGS